MLTKMRKGLLGRACFLLLEGGRDMTSPAPNTLNVVSGRGPPATKRQFTDMPLR